MEQINIRVTKDEKRQLKMLSSKSGLSLTGYLKFVGLNAEIQIKIKAENGN